MLQTTSATNKSQKQKSRKYFGGSFWPRSQRVDEVLWRNFAAAELASAERRLQTRTDASSTFVPPAPRATSAVIRSRGTLQGWQPYGEEGLIRVGSTRVTLNTVIGAFKDGASAEEIVQQYDVLELGDVYRSSAITCITGPKSKTIFANKGRLANAGRLFNRVLFEAKFNGPCQ